MDGTVHLIAAFFKSENIPDAALIRKISITRLQEVFSADAILYIDINAWDTSYTILSSSVDVGLSFALVDGKTGTEIWNSEAYAYSSDSISLSSMTDMVTSVVTTAVNAMTDYTRMANIANNTATHSLPYGHYHPDYKKDGEHKIISVDKAKIEENRLIVDKYFIFGEESDEDIPLIISSHEKGFHALSLTDLGGDAIEHNGYQKYYVTREIVGGQKIVRNRFFMYRGNNPFLVANNKQVFVRMEADGSIPYQVDESLFGNTYYFDIVKVVE